MSLEHSAPSGDQKPYEKAFQNKKRMAFLTTSLAIFTLICFVGSLSIRSFQTTGWIDVVLADENAEGIMQSVVQREISDESLVNHIETAQANAALIVNEDIVNQDLEAIKNALDFRVASHTVGNQIRLTTTFEGKGTAGEQALTQSLMQSLAMRLKNMSVDQALIATDLESEYEQVQSAIEQNSGALQSELVAAHQSVDRLNENLSDLHREVQSMQGLQSFLGENGANLTQQNRVQLEQVLAKLSKRLEKLGMQGVDSELIRLDQSVTEIRERLDKLRVDSNSESGPNLGGPMRVVNTTLPSRDVAVKGVLNSLEAMDTDSIQARIQTIQQDLKTNAIDLREKVATLQMRSRQVADRHCVVNSVSHIQTLPADAIPSLARVIWFALLAIGFGAAIATYYRPELVGVGFESIEDAERALGVPTITKLNTATEQGERRTEAKESFANAIVRYSEIGLFGFLFLTIILCYLQPDIRTAFFENPFYGLAKLAELFFGS